LWQIEILHDTLLPNLQISRVVFLREKFQDTGQGSAALHGGRQNIW
jgi:hypothetical protein